VVRIQRKRRKGRETGASGIITGSYNRDSTIRVLLQY